MANKKLKEKKEIRNNKRRKLEKKKKKKTKITTDSDTKPEISKSSKLQKLLEPYTKDQLIEFLSEFASTNSSLLKQIRTLADQDESHRKIFVHGLGWDTTIETLQSAFNSFGEIEDCKLVVDRVTGKAKGYGFVLFKSRASAAKALKVPQIRINNRLASCQLASMGPVVGSGSGNSNSNSNSNSNGNGNSNSNSQVHQDPTGRKIYVSNVNVDVDAEKLRLFFGKYGEIENGPMGFDMVTGKSRGFALFLYKTVEGARKVLEEPHKMFEGSQLHCQMANKPAVQQQQQNQNQQQQALQPTMLAAAAAAQNLAMFSQHPSLNPAYNGLFTNPVFLAGALNPLFQGGFNPGVVQSAQMGGTSMGLGGYDGMGFFGGNPSVVGTQGSIIPSMQGLQAYQNAENYLGQSSSLRTNTLGGPLSGYPSYM